MPEERKEKESGQQRAPGREVKAKKDIEAVASAAVNRAVAGRVVNEAVGKVIRNRIADRL